MRGPFRLFRDVKCYRESDAAIFVKGIDADDPQLSFIFPKSQVHDDSEVYAMGTSGKLIVTQWIADQKNVGEDGEEYER